MPTRDYAFERWVDSVLYGTTGLTIVKTNTTPVKKSVSPFEIRSVLSNRKKNAFTVVWADGTHTTVHCQSGDKWDDEKALAMCFTKKALGNKGNFNDKFNDALDNKMKVIPADPEPEKEYKCDNTCKVCECKMTVASVGENRNGSYLTEEAIANASTEEAVFKKPTNAFGIGKETATELSKAAAKADVALKDVIDALTGETVKVQRYNLLLVDPDGSANEIYHQGTDEEIHKAMRTYRAKYYPTLEANGTPYRVWVIKDNLMVDFGAGSYFMVPGMDHDTFVKGK